MTATARKARFEARRSPIHGMGVFATTRIRKGTRLTEYVGERISHAEAERRYDDESMDQHHTFLFSVDSRTCIDAAVDGNDARFINHSCDPNCEAVLDGGRIFIEAIRTIAPGAELTYDYRYEIDADIDDEIRARYACRCGAPACRGTIVALPPPSRVRRKAARRR